MSEDRLKGELQKLIADAKNPDALKDALAYLFPYIGSLLNSRSTTYASDQGFYSRRRISRPEYSRTYFNLTPDNTFWSRSETEELVASLPQTSLPAFEAKIREVSPHRKADVKRMFFEIIEVSAMQESHGYDWFAALVDNAGMFLKIEDSTAGSLFGLDSDHHITLLLADMLRKRDVESRCEIIQRAIVEVADISYLCSVFRYVAGDKELPTIQGSEPNAFGEDTDVIREKLISRVVDEAASGSLYTRISPGEILWFWRGAGYGEDVFANTTIAMGSRPSLLSLLRIPVSLVRSTAGNYEAVNRGSWSKIIDLDLLADKANVMATYAEGEEKYLAVRFLQALERDKHF